MAAARVGLGDEGMTWGYLTEEASELTVATKGDKIVITARGALSPYAAPVELTRDEVKLFVKALAEAYGLERIDG